MSYDDFDIDDVLAEEESDRDPDSEEIAAIAVNWRTLPNEDAPEKWEELRSWVEWISERYAIDESIIPDCWWKHGALVEELSALQTAWTVSYDTTDAGYGPIGFVERWHNAQARLRQLTGGESPDGPERPEIGSKFSDPTVHVVVDTQARNRCRSLSVKASQLRH